MKKYISFLLIITSFLLTSCDITSTSLTTSNNELDYSDFSSYQITPSQFFNMENESYYIYLYSNTCHACAEIKDEILEYAYKVNYEKYLGSARVFYFLEGSISNLNQFNYYFEININGTEEQYINETLNVNNLDDFSYYGTPTLYYLNKDNENKNTINSIYLGANSINNYILKQ